MERKGFDVRSARNAEFFRSERPWAAISISSQGGFPVLHERNRVGLLQLVFEDTTESDNDGAFNASLATQILDFVDGVWDQAEVFLIHCEVGLSRSPAIAAALSRIYYDDDGPWMALDMPNRLVYEVLVAMGFQRRKGDRRLIPQNRDSGH
jgi:predicted protein tyrosine phosphatase